MADTSFTFVNTTATWGYFVAKGKSCSNVAMGTTLFRFSLGSKQVHLNTTTLLIQNGSDCQLNVILIVANDFMPTGYDSVIVLSNQIFQHYTIHINYDTSSIAFEGGVIKDVPVLPSSGVATWVYVVVILGILVIVGVTVGVCMIKKRRALKNDLTQYNALSK